ncbi:unnamed protein product [Aureobasidium pullulans]|nr:unnamed protein product [Aureobasidium pullulans]
MTSSVPVNIPTTKQQFRRPSTFLSLSPVEKPAGPAATIFETLTSRAVIDSHPVSPKTITMLESKIDAGKPSTKNVSFQRHAVQHSIDQIYDAEGDVRSREDVMDDIDNDTLASAQLRAEEQKNAENLGGRSSRQQLRSAGLSQPMGSTGRSPSRHDSATGRRTTRSRSPAKRSTATVTSSRDGPNPPQTTTSPAKTTLQRGRNIFIGFESTPPENLTPQEKKDNKLDGDRLHQWVM